MTRHFARTNYTATLTLLSTEVELRAEERESVCMCVCVCEREREREREKKTLVVCAFRVSKSASKADHGKQDICFLHHQSLKLPLDYIVSRTEKYVFNSQNDLF